LDTSRAKKKVIATYQAKKSPHFIGEIAIHPLELAALGEEILKIVSCLSLDSEGLLMELLG
jgi:hypothetical protein